MQNSLIRTTLCIILISGLFPKTNLYAQNTGEYKKLFYWLNIGAGPGTGKKSSDMAIGSLIEIVVAKDNSVFFAGLREFGEGSTEDWSTTNIRDKMQCFELRYGRSFQNKNNIAFISTGFSYVSGTFKGDLLDSEGGWFSIEYIYEKISGFGVGIPFSAQFLRIISKRFALGLEAYANINRVCSFYGVNFNVNFGKFHRSKKQN